MNTIKHKIHDVVLILRELWFIVIFIILGGAAFMFVQQGQDMMYAVIDDFYLWPFAASLLALSIWAMQTGFGARITLIFSDISFYPKTPEGLTEEEQKQFELEVDQRVERRKRLASVIPRVLFTAPYIIMIGGYIKAFKTYSTGSDDPGHFALCLILTILSGIITYKVSYNMYRKAFADKQSAGEQNKARKLQRAGTLKELGNLRTVFFLAVSSAWVLIAVYSFLNIGSFQFLGAVHLITLGFGCWIGVTYWIDYLDRNRKLFLKLFLFIYICVISFYNHDHPVRIKEGAYVKPEHDLPAYFNNWYTSHEFKADSSEVPVFFVSAEGGACRSGYWTTIALAGLQDEMPSFKDHIFSYSSVSGGTLGVNAFNAICKYKEAHPQDTRAYLELAQTFYAEDFLAPVTGRMVFGDMFNLLSPRMLECFDRAGVLEKTWEQSYAEAISKEENLMEESFNTVNGKGPAIFVNTTEVETGRRALLSNIIIDSSFIDVVSVQDRLGANVRYSTAILFSARFPYLSPAGAIQQEKEPDSFRRHYVDGGYFENMGNVTTMEVIQSVKQYCRLSGRKIKPVVLLITNDAPAGEMKTLRFANELVEPLNAFMNVRSGHTQHTLAEMRRFINYPDINGTIVRFNMDLNGTEVPMNWFMSEGTKQRVNDLLNEPKFTDEKDKVKQMLQ